MINSYSELKNGDCVEIDHPDRKDERVIGIIEFCSCNCGKPYVLSDIFPSGKCYLHRSTPAKYNMEFSISSMDY